MNLAPPRPQATARRILLTILGEFVLPHQRPVWNACLVEAMVAAGQTEKSARQAILRTAHGGWLAKQRHGKNVSWELTPKVIELLMAGISRVYPTDQPTQSWDGRWIILHVSLPDHYRKRREKLYKALQWAGFGSPSAGLWICPHTNRQDEIARAMRQLGLSEITFSFIGSSANVGATDQRMVNLSWDLDQISRHYAQLLREFGKRKPDGDSILSRYVRLVTEWQKLPYIDPRLPHALIPADRQGHHIAAELSDLLQLWREPARLQWMEIVNKLPQPDTA